ncbi:PREDICTED: neuropeptide Y receptor-like isoform X2 [Papilio polytes]|uniref:neuropeptide Y receptor-like isoform X2 n=1 Tax=Papilio polytes TaxID=76194 RepID=UPI000675FF07|nr:PREDICTED: neuropeptide Y receptor-like isoform X2 [Papilio polytes]XP_013139025.1 PREDICTED: neuropeptide Y receptor-like isoform X2 [Papilio polytes]
MIETSDILIGNNETSTSPDDFPINTTSGGKTFENVSNYKTKWTDISAICSPSSSSEDFLSSTTFQICVYFMYSAVFVVALLGNGLVCFVVQNSPRMKTVTNYFIVNLAVGDILMTLFCVPFSFVSMLILRYWPFGSIMCKIVNYSQAVSVFVSAYTLLAISIDRYMAIIRPLRPRLGKTSAKLVVVGVWCGALATAGPIPIVSEIQRPTDWHQICKADICLEQWSNPDQSHHYTCALMVLQFLVPLMALVCTYARIAHVVWGGRPPGEALSERDTRMQHSKRKMVKMMVTVVAVFITCWLPLNIFIVLWTVHEKDEKWATWAGMPYVWFASHWLAMSHSCYNPIIYCYMNARYKRGYKQALSCLLCCKKGPASRSFQRSSVCEGVPLSEMVAANGILRRGTSSSCVSRLHRAPTCSSCGSLKRGHIGGAISRNSINKHLVRNTDIQTPPVRALSIRSHFN